MTTTNDRAYAYVLGILDAQEHHQVVADLKTDPDLKRAVCHWQDALAPLAAPVPQVENPIPWDAVADALARDRDTD